MARDPMSSIKAAITRFDAACQDKAFLGAQDPETRSQTNQEHTLARESLERLIAKAITRSKS